MSKVVKIIVGAALVVAGVVTGNFQLIMMGVSMVGGALLQPKMGNRKRAASSAQVQIGEVPREAIVGTAATAGSLVDGFNYGGKYGTDWEVLVIALADHRCAGLQGFYVNDVYVPYSADGNVAGYNNQLQVYWRSGTEAQTVPAILTSYGPGWTANDNGAGVAYVVVAYKADAADAKEPVWPGGRPRFMWVVRGALCYDPRKDSTVGGSGSHRIDVPATWEYSDNPIVTRYKWVRGFYACDRVGQPAQLLVGRGLTAIEAPPQNVFARANLCDEMVGGEKRYRVGGAINAAETFIEVEEDFAAACAGTIVQPEGCVEIDPGEARAIVKTFTDRDLVVGSRVRWNNRILSVSSDEWVNTVVASYIEPTQKWAEHAAPVQRDPADILADGMPRELRLLLGFVTWTKQAQRCAEIVRRMGRLPGRAEVTLPPRFSEIEEGDWVQWQSDRHFGGATLTFRVDGWGSNEKWHHTLTLRQISASVYSDTAPLDDGSIAAPSPVPPAIGAPNVANWSLAAGHVTAGGMKMPVLVVTGATDDTAARFVKVEYVLGEAAPGPGTVWINAGVTGPDVERREISAAPGGTYRVAISYVVNDVPGDRLILGPVTAGAIAYPDDTPVEELQPAEGGATRGATPEQIEAISDALALAASRGRLFMQTAAPGRDESNPGDTWIDDNGVFYDRVPNGGILLAGKIITLGGYRPTMIWTPAAVQPLSGVIATAAGAASLAAEAYTTANEAIDELIGLADDEILSINEKVTKLVPDSARLELKWISLAASATALGVSSAAAAAARTAWLGFLGGLVPAWNDITQPTPVSRTAYNGFRDAYDDALYQLGKAVNAEAARRGVWSAIINDGAKPQDNADVTALSQVVVVPAPTFTLYRTSAGAVKSEQLPADLRPLVTVGGVDKRTDNAFAYAVTGFGGLAGKVTVNTTNGSAGKGDVTLANTITGEGYFELSVSRSGVPVGTYTTQVVTVDDLPPINNAGAGGTDTTLTAITSTAYATMTSQDSGDPVLDVVITGVGDTLKLVANFKYQHIPATATGSPASMTCKAECSSDNWATVIAMDGGGADATGSPSQAGTPEDRVKGELIHTFTKTGLAAGTYKVRLQGKKTAAASGTLQVQSGSATSSKA